MTLQLTRAETNTLVFVNLASVTFYEPAPDEQTQFTFIDGSVLIVVESCDVVAQQEGATLPQGVGLASRNTQNRLTRPQRG